MVRFTAQDRCDGCSAQAKYLIVLSTGGTLQLCGHHTRRNTEALDKLGALILEPAEDTAEEPSWETE
jgi:hypothetical protein